MSCRLFFRASILAGILMSVGLTLIACSRTPVNSKQSSGERRDINAVLADHDKELMAISGVVGVYVGLLGDGKTQCLKVMLARKDAELERSIPRSLEGYPVLTEVTGEIKPFRR